MDFSDDSRPRKSHPVVLIPVSGLITAPTHPKTDRSEETGKIKLKQETADCLCEAVDIPNN